MESDVILYPILAHTLLVAAMYVVLAIRKAAAVKAGLVDRKAAALDNHAWPAEVRKVTNNITNNFESPVLFYGVVFTTYLLGAAGSLAVGLSIAYVVLRYIHSYIHIGSNYVPHRLRIFSLSLLVILALAVQTAMAVT